MATRRTVEQWQAHVGQQVRTLRLRADLTQEQLAHNADTSTSTIHHLESGDGTSLATLIKIVRALGRADWLEELAPPVAVSPMQLLHQRQQEGAGKMRASGRRLT